MLYETHLKLFQLLHNEFVDPGRLRAAFLFYAQKVLLPVSSLIFPLIELTAKLCDRLELGNKVLGLLSYLVNWDDQNSESLKVGYNTLSVPLGWAGDWGQFQFVKFQVA